MTHQPDDLGEAYAELQQEDLSIRDEDTLTDNTDEANQRVHDEDPLSADAQPDEEGIPTRSEPEPPAAIP
ncbi:MAG: hypothetical protein ACOC84_08340 [Actinomycetota bacterium]